MDLGWRVVLDFLYAGLGHRVTGKPPSSPPSVAVIEGHGLVCIRLEGTPMGSKQLRMWGRLAMQEQVGGPAALSASLEVSTALVRSALKDRDALTLYRKVRSVLHTFCTRITVVSGAESGAGIMVSQVVWNSRIHCPSVHNAAVTHLDTGDRFTVGTPTKCKVAPNAGLFAAGPGCVLVVSVAEEFRSVLPLTTAYLPLLEPDSDMLATLDLTFEDTHGAALRALSANGDEEDGQRARSAAPTPAPLESMIASPTRNNNFDELVAPSPQKLMVETRDVQCELCGGAIPPPLTVVLSQCGHTMCLTCAMACCAWHVSVRDATPLNMLCPHFACPTFLTRTEVRHLCSSTSAFATLELNELRGLLGENATQCPQCYFMFERLPVVGLERDPLKDKLICVACHGTFCAACQTHPFHEDRQCPEGGSSGSAAPRCRYCQNLVGPKGGLEGPVCNAPTCQTKGAASCLVPKKCGHQCHGSCGEKACVACLEEGCSDCHPVHNSEEFCAICFTDTLGDAPCLQLDCTHVFHKHCLESKLESKWPTSRINFRFLDCPLCAQEINHHLLSKLLAPVHKLREALDDRMKDRLRIEGLHSSEALTDPTSSYFEKPLEFARAQFNYYQCSECERPYYGGLRRCQDVEREEPNKKDLICGGCSAGSASCARHGPSHLEWKCKYCCNTAVWFCWGTTHFCELCHSPPRKTVREECKGEEKCPLKALHPPNGSEFAIGCSMCRSAAQEAATQHQQGDVE